MLHSMPQRPTQLESAEMREREIICETQYPKMCSVDASTYIINFDNGQNVRPSGAHKRFHVKPRTSTESVATTELKSAQCIRSIQNC